MKKKYMSLAAVLLMVIMSCGWGGGTDAAPAPLSSEKAIAVFSLGGVIGTINEVAKTIAVSMPFGTNVTALVATFTTTGASVTVGSTVQISGTTVNNFTEPRAYTVTAADNTSVIYTVTITVAAPLVSLPKTGQTVCYGVMGGDPTHLPPVINCANTGQDGDVQKGIAWPNPRFTDNGDQTITDNLTGLIWTKDSNAPGPAGCNPGQTWYTWQQALDYAACLNTNNYLGHNDWRLPNVNELESLVNYGQSNIATWLNTQGFSNSGFADWSSTTSATYINNAWLVSGDANLYTKVADFYVWPVRAGQSGSVNLPKTGQTVCYGVMGGDPTHLPPVINCANTGQDEDVQKGVTWPNPRFTDQGDQTITDNLTGLMWTKDSNAPGPAGCTPGVTKRWQDALAYAACLNTNNYLGHNDWRLPNVNELKSLVHFGQSNPATWLNMQGFSNVQNNLYLSSTTHAQSLGCEWVVNMNSGYVSDGGKTTNYYVWPVRAGQ